MLYKYTTVFCGLLLITLNVLGQSEEKVKVKEAKRTPYELLTTYYNDDFKPFKKGTIYFGSSLSLEDRSMENTESLFQKVLDGDRVNFNILLKGGYYINNYSMVGLNANIFENKFTGTVLKGSDAVESTTITRGFSFTPNYKTSIPLAKNERLSFFTATGLTLGKSNTLKRETMNMDEIEKSFSEKYNLKVGLSPGVTFFAMEKFALEVQLDVVSYELNIENKTKNAMEESRDVRHNVDFKLDLLSLKFGVAYYL